MSNNMSLSLSLSRKEWKVSLIFPDGREAVSFFKKVLSPSFSKGNRKFLSLSFLKCEGKGGKVRFFLQEKASLFFTREEKVFI